MFPTLTNTGRKLKRGTLCRRRRRQLPAVFLMTDEHRLPFPDRAVSSLPRGSGVVLRHYGDPARDEIAMRIESLCRRRGLLFSVGGNWRLAARMGAHGLHLPAHMTTRGPSPGARLWIRRRNALLTVAAHDSIGLRRASKVVAVAAFLSPIFYTLSHPGRPPLGPVRCAAMVRNAKVAVIALGGITAKKINALRDTGCIGIAGIGFASQKSKIRTGVAHLRGRQCPVA